jgi:Cys-rich four helix bundle protein (predicted Tat secretion target)
MTNLPSRRTLVAGAAAIAAATAASAIAKPAKGKGDKMPMDHGGMDHGQMADMPGMDHMAHGGHFELTREEKRVVTALAQCQVAGEACLSHCIESLAAGDTSMAACARSVRAMLAVCKAAQVLVETHSAFAGQQISLCRDACSACETECQPHKDHHETCRDCASACHDAMDAIDRLLG